LVGGSLRRINEREMRERERERAGNDIDNWTAIGRNWSDGRVEVLLVSLPPADNDTYLMTAAEEGCEAAVKALMRHGDLDVGATDELGGTAMHKATEKGREDVVGLLIGYGGHIDAKDNDVWASLHQTAKNGLKEVAGLLIAHGAHVDAQQWIHTSSSCGSGWTRRSGWLAC